MIDTKVDVVEANPIAAAEDDAPALQNENGAPVRFNATMHSIRSRLPVMPHEDYAEHDRLPDALMAKHDPDSTTEQHLMEQLASVIWRKRRVLQVEGAAINRGPRSVALSKTDSPAPAAAPFECWLSAEDAVLSGMHTEMLDHIAHTRSAGAGRMDRAHHGHSITNCRRRDAGASRFNAEPPRKTSRSQIEAHAGHAFETEICQKRLGVNQDELNAKPRWARLCRQNAPRFVSQHFATWLMISAKNGA